MMNYFKLIALGLITLFALIAANYARDLAYMVNALVVALAAAGMFLWVLRQTDEPVEQVDLSGEYMDGVIRAGVIATTLWGVVGFLAGTFIAFQLAFPVLNFEWAQGLANFGRLRPLHTSAVIFAFGGNALICTSFYVVQRTSAARLWGGNLGWFVFWGYQLVHRAGRHRLPAGGHPIQGIRRAGMVCRHLADRRVAGLSGRLHGHDFPSPREAYLRGQLVLSGLHHHRGDAACGQQHLSIPVSRSLAPNRCRCSPACKTRWCSGGMATTPWVSS